MRILERIKNMFNNSYDEMKMYFFEQAVFKYIDMEKNNNISLILFRNNNIVLGYTKLTHKFNIVYDDIYNLIDHIYTKEYLINNIIRIYQYDIEIVIYEYDKKNNKNEIIKIITDNNEKIIMYKLLMKLYE